MPDAGWPDAPYRWPDGDPDDGVPDAPVARRRLAGWVGAASGGRLRHGDGWAVGGRLAYRAGWVGRRPVFGDGVAVSHRHDIDRRLWWPVGYM